VTTSLTKVPISTLIPRLPVFQWLALLPTSPMFLCSYLQAVSTFPVFFPSLLFSFHLHICILSSFCKLFPTFISQTYQDHQQPPILSALSPSAHPPYPVSHTMSHNTALSHTLKMGAAGSSRTLLPFYSVLILPDNYCLSLFATTTLYV
jgi:hypothetical protein